MGTAPDVGLLTAPLTLARAPLRLTLRAWEFGLSTAAEAARIGFELLERDGSSNGPGFERYRAPADPGFGGNGGPPEPAVPLGGSTVAPSAPDFLDAEPPPPVAASVDAPPAVPDELIPDHVDQEVVLVAESAEDGAENGAGPELHVDPPWDTYDHMTAADIRDRLVAASPVEAAAVELYEATHKSRRTVLDAAERALKSGSS
ncbi:MAG TPA: hypothetical protein VGO83_08160 [Thermoleophilaceae bacterium]|nr:hypothetical protein [Thermoleophilaceae bacterium]